MGTLYTVILAPHDNFSTHILEWEELTIFELLLCTYPWAGDVKYIMSVIAAQQTRWC